MRYLAFALVLFGSIVAQAQAADINFGEARTRFQIQNDPTAKERLRPWAVDWRHTYAWQHGTSKWRGSFAPPGCFITRWVVTPSSAGMQELFIC